MVHGIGARSSLDLDFSMENDVDDPQRISVPLFNALRVKFHDQGIVLFDESFTSRPSNRVPGSRWGGYNAECKLIPRELYDRLNGDVDAIRRQAIESGPRHQRIFRLEMSPFEYCEAKVSIALNGQLVLVYSIAMIAVEKLRAICQQDPDYPHRLNPTARARDFYDIYCAVNEGAVDFANPEIHRMVRKVFAAKGAELSLIPRIHLHREFHRSDWPSVQNAVATRLHQFDFYFDYVLSEIERLEPLWKE